MIDKQTLEQWNAKKWRKPDVWIDGYAIWYGPGGAEGENATEVELDSMGIQISEYQYLPGLVDGVVPGEEFLKTSTYLDIDDVLRALKGARIRKPKTDKDLIRWAVGLGVAQIAYWGGDEDYTDELPR